MCTDFTTQTPVKEYSWRKKNGKTKNEHNITKEQREDKTGDDFIIYITIPLTQIIFPVK
jgi:hypothetical protein